MRGGGQTCERDPTDDVREALAKAKQEFEEAVTQVEQDLTTEEALLDPYTLFCLARVYAGTSITLDTHAHAHAHAHTLNPRSPNSDAPIRGVPRAIGEVQGPAVPGQDARLPPRAVQECGASAVVPAHGRRTGCSQRGQRVPHR